jgi:hypothetical protein
MGRPALNPWIVALAVVVPTFMEVLDTTIANVALRDEPVGRERLLRKVGNAIIEQFAWFVQCFLSGAGSVLSIATYPK